MPLPDVFEFQLRTRIVFGQGLVKDVGFEAGKLKGTRAFVVTDKVVRKLGLLQRVLDGFADSGVAVVGVFDDVPPNSEVAVVERGATAARATGCDLLVALGGGSVMDTAKAMNMLLVEGGALLDWQGTGLLSRPLLPVIAIPTTAGTGSEVTIAAVIRDQAQGLKLEFNSPYMMPDVALLDPELTLGLPPALTASTGIDALTHAIEGYVSLYAEPVSDALCLHAIRLVTRYLPRAVDDGDDIEARGYMLLAATIAGGGFSNALCGVVHALAHACGGRYGVPHGVANGILLAHGMAFNLEAASDRFGDIAGAMGLPVHGMTAEGAAQAAIDAAASLRQRIGLPNGLREVGVPREGFVQLAEDALGDAMMISNPRSATQVELVHVLEKAY
jgi:alcohol dehydrogenase class IV